MASARSIFRIFLLLTALTAMVGCVHGQPGTQYEIVDGSLVRGADALIDLGQPAATYETSLLWRGGSQFLVRESFTNEKNLLLVELLPGELTGRVISIHRSLMTLDAFGAPTWSGVEVLDSGFPLDSELWDRVFELTASLPAPTNDGPPPVLGSTVSVRTFKNHAVIGEHRMFSPTAPESPLDALRLGSLRGCDQRLESGEPMRYAMIDQNHAIIDVVLHHHADGPVSGSYRAPGESRPRPLKGEQAGSDLVLRSMDGHVVFKGRRRALIFTGRAVLLGQEPVVAVLGCAEL